jgi:hypothetical protein
MAKSGRVFLRGMTYDRVAYLENAPESGAQAQGAAARTTGGTA